MPAKKPRSDLLSVEQVAADLNITERTVWNLIPDKLVPEEISGRTWIPLVELNRYKHIHNDTFLDRAFSSFPSADTPEFIRGVNFGPWGQTMQFELEVTLEDWWRFAIKPRDNEAEYDRLKAEVRSRLGPSTPEHFYVRFKINQEALAATLDQVVASVKVPELPILKEELKQDAKKHLIDHVLPRLQKAKKSPRSYLQKAVEYFYIDKTREEHHEISFGELDEVGEDVLKLDSRLRIHLEWMFENQPDLVRELHNSNKLESHLEDKYQQARDLFLRLKEQGRSEEEASHKSVRGDTGATRRTGDVKQSAQTTPVERAKGNLLGSHLPEVHLY